MTPPVLNMLFVDDNPGDRDLAKEAMEENGGIRLLTAADGEEAMDLLNRRGSFADAERPHFILLDLNMPRKGGLEMLREMKADDAFKAIPVIIFSSSAAAEDLRQAYQAHASAYVVKPSTLREFLSAVQQIGHFWQKVAILIQQ